MEITITNTRFKDLNKMCGQAFAEDKQILAVINGIDDLLMAGKNAFQTTRQEYTIKDGPLLVIRAATALVVANMESSQELENDKALSMQKEEALGAWQNLFKLPPVGQSYDTLLYRLCEDQSLL